MRPRSPSLAREVAQCLKADFGTRPDAVRRVSEQTGASSGAVKKWFGAKTSLNGVFLIKLIAASPSVMKMVDRRIGRAWKTAALRRRARQALPILKELAGR